jgi:hypothetical protein
MVARQYDGWSDFPTKTGSPNYGLAMQNARAGAATGAGDVHLSLGAGAPSTTMSTPASMTRPM